jgi:DNA polymerase-3 subunit gamma/tau
MSLALARKYRPKRFADVAVQSHVSNTLRGAIARGRVAHGYLLCGPRGVGKTTLARVLAMALNCENKQGDGEPCGECISCQRIWSGSSSLDVVEIDAASNRGVDDARDLRERAMYAPSGDDRYKVYIVDEAHMLTREAWNALLKILEEPPPRVIFVFATTEPQKIAQAAAPVLSRLQRFDLKRIGLSDITQRLSTVLDGEGVKASDDALSMIARAADGSMRDALSLTDQVISIGDGAVTAERVREALGLVPEDEFLAIVDIIAGHRAGEIFDAVKKLADAGVDFGVFLSGFADILRAQLTVVLNGKAEGVSATAAAALRERRDLFTAGDLLRMLSAVNALEPTFRKSSQQQLLIEMLLVRMALLDRTVALEDLLKGLGGESTPAARGDATQGAARTDVPSGSVRTQPTQASVARTAQRPATKPGYPPQLDAPNALSPSVTSKPSAPSANEGQLREMKRAMETTAQDSNRSRMTPEALKEERIGMLRQKDPALGAAIDELDLELLD